MSDEEKEIFNNLKEYMQDRINNGYHKFIYNDLDWDFKCIDCINAIDNALKQSKEIEDNRKYIVQLTHEQYRKLVDIIRDEISKEWEDKIKAKIEEVQKMKAKAKDIVFKSSLNYIETELQSLLEKE